MRQEYEKKAATPTYDQAQFAARVDEVLGLYRQTLIEKNRLYGDSALSPLNVFSQAKPAEQLRIAIDHKLSRLARGIGNSEDTTLDLACYLVLLRIAEKETNE